MSQQIAVRLPEEVVAYLDERARSVGESRAAVILRALDLQRARESAERDAQILAETGDYEDLKGLAAFSAAQATDA